MRVAVTTAEPSLEAAIDPRFGRCPYFLIVETDDLRFEAIQNPNAGLLSGAGIQAARWLAGMGVDYVLTGSVGPNAEQALEAAGLGVLAGCSGTVREVLEGFKRQAPVAPLPLDPASLPDTRPQASRGLPGSGPPRAGRGLGRGRGGGGRGAGRGGGGLGGGGGRGRGGRGGGGGMGS